MAQLRNRYGSQSVSSEIPIAREQIIIKSNPAPGLNWRLTGGSL